MSRSISAGSRSRIMSRDNFTCAYCSDAADVIDRIMPYSFSHDSSDANLVAACRRCNSLVSDLVFGSLTDKQFYIANALDGKALDYLVITRGRYTKDICYCADCKKLFPPAILGATNILCPRCARNAETGKKLRITATFFDTLKSLQKTIRRAKRARR